MTYDHTQSRFHRDELDREIETIRTERLLADRTLPRDGIVDGVRRGTGRILIAAGSALIGPDRGSAPLRLRHLDRL